MPSKSFLPFTKARSKVRKFNLSSKASFKKWSKSYKGVDLPLAPEIVYKNKGWVSWPDFLGSNTFKPSERSKNFWSYKKARSFVRRLKFKSKTEFRTWVRGEIVKTESGIKLPKFPLGKIPFDPEMAYKNEGFKNLRDFLGTSNLAFYQKKVTPFNKAWRWARNNNKKELIKDRYAWLKYVEASKRDKKFKHIRSGKFKGLFVKPHNIPDDPEKTYRDVWLDWDHFLIWVKPKLEPIAYMPYKQAKKFVHKLGLKNQVEWKIYAKLSRELRKHNSKILTIPKGKYKGLPIKPVNLPSAVYEYYRQQKREKFSFGDFLGTGNVQNQRKGK